jgi:hypothetical protein
MRPSAPFFIRIASLAVLAGLTLGCKTPTIEKIQASIEIVDVKTQWVAKEYRQWPEPKLVLVPQVRFKVKNLTTEPLRYVNFNAIFKHKLDKENLGDNFLAAIRKDPVPPGGLSPEIILTSNFGVEGRNLAHFKVFPQQLEYDVLIYAQFKGSRHALLGDWKVSGTIDFKEDEAVHQEGKVIDKAPETPVK